MYICACMCVFVNEVNVSLMNSLLITTTDMGYCIITFLLLFKLTYHFTEIIQANSPRFSLAYGNCPLVFKHTCSFSNFSVLLSILIYRCFITLFSTRLCDYNFETFCSCKLIPCVLKSEYILLNIELNILNIEY